MGKLTREQAKLKMEQTKLMLRSSGLTFVVRHNNSEQSSVPNHLTIIGNVRNVDYWPGTETVYAPGVKGKYKAIRAKSITEAIRIAKDGR